MKTNKNLNLALYLLAAGALLYGCGTKRVTESEVPNEPNAEDHPIQKKVVVNLYTVKKRDTLWAIAGKPDNYGDSFEWPLIYKANRDKISDPDLIYPAQVFRIDKKLPADELAEAKKLADETPKYSPHHQPRKKLPVDYF